MSKIIKRPTYVSESMPKFKYQFFFWYRLRDDVIQRKSTVILTLPPTRALVSSDCTHQPAIHDIPHQDLTQHSGLTGIELLTMSSTDCNRATKPQWLWLFQSKYVHIYLRTHEDIKGFENSKIKKFDFSRYWTLVSVVIDSDTRRFNHYATGSCIGTSEVGIYLNGHHLVSHIKNLFFPVSGQRFRTYHQKFKHIFIFEFRTW